MDCLSNMPILTILILPTQEHIICFHFFELSSISLITILSFPEYRPFTSLIKFILKYFILFDVILNGIFSFFTFYFWLLLVHRKSAYFYILIWYSATLLNSFINSREFFGCWSWLLRIFYIDNHCLQIGIVLLLLS